MDLTLYGPVSVCITYPNVGVHCHNGEIYLPCVTIMPLVACALNTTFKLGWSYTINVAM